MNHEVNDENEYSAAQMNPSPTPLLPSNYDPGFDSPVKRTKKKPVMTTELEHSEMLYDDDDEMNEAQQNEEKDALIVTSPEFEVKVCKPQVRDDGLVKRKHIEYEVSGKDHLGVFEVRRRYKEFDKLHEKLSKNWIGYFVPNLPMKRATGNMNPNFVMLRLRYLDRFMKRCLKFNHLFRSQEMQTFLRPPDQSVPLVKQLEKLPVLTNRQMFERNKALNPRFAVPTTEHVETSVRNLFRNLKPTIEFFEKFVRSSEILQSATERSLNRIRPAFYQFIVTDYKSKSKSQEDVKVMEGLMDGLVQEESKDVFGDFMPEIKELESDLRSFSMIPMEMQEKKEKMKELKQQVQELNKKLGQARLTEGNDVSVNLFKKMSKVQRIAQLEQQILAVACGSSLV